MPQVEIGALQHALDGVRGEMAEQNDLIKAQNEKLAKVEAKLPNFLGRRQFRTAMVAIVLVILLAMFTVWQLRQADIRRQNGRAADLAVGAQAAATARDEAIWRNACSLRGVLSLAQSSATRNPVPPGLGADLTKLVEDSRKQAAAFYAKSIADIDATLETLGRGPCPLSPLAEP